jgi:hypothetical protein
MLNRFFTTGILLIALLAYGQTAVSGTVFEAGAHFGGDELITEAYSNGERGSIKAGGVFSLALGGTKDFTKNIQGQFSIGIKSDDVYPGETKVTWVRYPLNVMIFYRRTAYRLGLGLTTHFSPKLKGSDVASNISESYKDAIGGILEVDFNIDKSFLWGLRYTNINYESGLRDRTVNGNSVGILIIALL